ncbi:MAG: T9SS type A sorting domain-containing protein [Ignavibacteriae bacterium]|nr:T9SS C-terminal target domain-containing protein [Ignavibacteriota bacterium]NOG98938.1 T9SS type A sorting domain-containing protein [Ignavibacteriota bacterium]
MKSRNTIGLIFLFLTSTLFAQSVPNGGFEGWSGANINDWTHNGSASIPTVTQTTDAYSGSFAVQGEVIDFFNTAFPPTLFTGTQAQPLFPMSSHPTTLTGQYQYEPQGGDILLIEIVLINQSIGGGAEGHVEITEAASGYTAFEIPIIYSEDNPPGWQPTEASVTIVISPSAGDLPHVGSKFKVDHISFENSPLDVKEIKSGILPNEFKLEQNYPNPFNPTTNINFSIADEGEVKLEIYNMLGEKISTLVNQYLSAGNYSADWSSAGLPSGTYIYRLTANDYSQSRKMILLK